MSGKKLPVVIDDKFFDSMQAQVMARMDELKLSRAERDDIFMRAMLAIGKYVTENPGCPDLEAIAVGGKIVAEALGLAPTKAAGQ